MKGSKNWYAQIYIDGRAKRMSTGTAIKEEAKAFLKNLLLDATGGKPFAGDVKKVTYSDLRAGLIANYAEKGNKSLLVRAEGTEFINGLDALDAHFEFEEGKRCGVPLTRITTDAARAFASKRLAEGVTNSTVNNSLALLRRMLRIGYEDGKLSSVPVIRLLKANPARKGFVAHEKFEELIEHLPLHLRPLITFLYWCGVRLGEALQITWDQVDLDAALIRLEDEQTKSGEARTIPLPDVLVGMLKTVEVREDNVFDKTNLRKAWAKACVAVGLGTLEPVDKSGNRRYNGLIVHDLRRSAIRNLRKAGVPESVAMKISGHKTRAVFERYNIVDTEDLVTAMKRAEYSAQQLQITAPKVSESSVRVRTSRVSRRQLTA
jgi:integrase